MRISRDVDLKPGPIIIFNLNFKPEVIVLVNASFEFLFSKKSHVVFFSTLTYNLDTIKKFSQIFFYFVLSFLHYLQNSTQIITFVFHEVIGYAISCDLTLQSVFRKTY